MEHIFNNLYVLEKLKKDIIPTEYKERIQKVSNYYFDKSTGERYYYNYRVNNDTSIETLVTSSGLIFTKEYKKYGNDIILICTINDIVVKDVAEFERCKRYRVAYNSMTIIRR